MKIQLEQLDLAAPWPQLVLKDGYYAMSVLVRMGSIPIGDVLVRPVRRRVASHRGLRKRIAKKHSGTIVRTLVKQALACDRSSLGLFARAQCERLAGKDWKQTCGFVRDNLLLPEGLPQPYRSWITDGADSTPDHCPPITVLVCTRDRAQQLEGCIRCLKSLDYPEFDILICDNSADSGPTREVCERLGVDYVREPIAGLSRARNAALAAARTRWVAFTDDDCRPEPNWLKELARPLINSNCAGVCGLVLPAQLENSAEITFEIYGGLGRGYQPVVYDGNWLKQSWTKPPQTWRVGAGANMLLDRELVLKLGGYDVDMGPGGVGGCGEDTLVFYQILREWFTIHYAPRAIVHHYHRSSDAALRKHIRSYAVGHAAYHWYVLWRYRDQRSLLQLCWHLPLWFARNIQRGIRGKTKYPFNLVPIEIKGTFMGPIQFTAVKVVKWLTRRLVKQPAANLPPRSIPALPQAVARQQVAYVDDARQKRARVA